MNKKIILTYLLVCATFYIHTRPILQGKDAKMHELESWLTLDHLKKKLESMMTKYTNIQTELKNETNQVLVNGIQQAEQVAQKDPYAALLINYELKKLVNQVDATSLDIDAINTKYQELTAYIEQSIKELSAMRLRSLRFP